MAPQHTNTERYEIVVAGGGLAGLCAAVAAARQGAKTCLLHDRPVLGGNSSSEIRVAPLGAANNHAFARETGIILELQQQERATNFVSLRNDGQLNSCWDLVLYDVAVSTPNLTIHLNTAVTDVIMHDERTIVALLARIANAETELRIEGNIFLDCTGDGFVADRAGCEWRMGSESRDEFGEWHAPQQASQDTMGSSIMFLACDTGKPAPFNAPAWAIQFENPDFFYKQGREISEPSPEGWSGYWWIEIGIPWHIIYDNETIRHQLLRYVLGIWDWIKNRDPRWKERAKNYALDWVGQVPGKRESRRILGLYMLTENDLQGKPIFPDEIAYGGWFIDLHTAGGLLGASSEPGAALGYDSTTDYMVHSVVGPYGIPLRILIARDVDNLLMAGRNVSVTHAALGSLRLMATTSLLGQAAGTAGAVAITRGLKISSLTPQAVTEIQQTLLREGCFLPHYHNEDPEDLARSATITAGSEAKLWGVGPSTPRQHLTGRWISLSSETARLTTRFGQLFATDGHALESLAVCLSNTSNQLQYVAVKLIDVEDIWDYRSDGNRKIAETRLAVPPGRMQWMDWIFSGVQGKLGFMRLDVEANPEVIWQASPAIEPGMTAMYEVAPGKMQRFHGGVSLSYRITPPQHVYAPQNIINGVTRPHRFTNLWKSKQGDPLPVWIQLQWDQVHTIAQVDITFDGYLIHDYYEDPAYYRDPQCVRDYTLEAWSEGTWNILCQVTENYQRRRRHILPSPISTDKLRLIINATNGAPNAGVYEIRCYAEAK